MPRMLVNSYRHNCNALCWGPNIPRGVTVFGSHVPEGVNTAILQNTIDKS